MLTFYHCPFSRSVGTAWLLAELGVPHETEIVDIRAPEGIPASYRAIQAHGKVPAIVHDGVAITERAAIAIYLADAFPEAGLAPPLGDPRRGPYLSWLVYVDAVLDPAIAARMNGWQYEARGVSFGTAEDALAHVERTLSAHPYVAGERFTAADVALGGALHWIVGILKAAPETDAIGAFLERIRSRPAFQRTMGAPLPEGMTIPRPRS